jgi:hypothetical protein
VTCYGVGIDEGLPGCVGNAEGLPDGCEVCRPADCPAGWDGDGAAWLECELPGWGTAAQ